MGIFRVSVLFKRGDDTESPCQHGNAAKELCSSKLLCQTVANSLHGDSGDDTINHECLHSWPLWEFLDLLFY